MNSLNDIRAARNRSVKLLIALTLTLTLVLSGCSGGEEDGESGDSGGPSGTTQSTQETQPTTETTMQETVMEETMMEETMMEETMATSPEETQEDPGDSGGESGVSTALSGGLETAQSEAEDWNEDAELYAIASLRPVVNAQGESRGWLYSFVSESTGSVISIPYSGGEARNARGQNLPEGQIERISSTTISVEDLIDSQEAMNRSGEVQGYLEENPQAGASAGLDSASRDEPEWILSVPEQAIQNRVSAAK